MIANKEQNDLTFNNLLSKCSRCYQNIQDQKNSLLFKKLNNKHNSPFLLKSGDRV